MHRITRILTGAVLFALVLLTTPTTAMAQACSGSSTSQDCTWTATVTVASSLSCSVTSSFNFGTAHRGDILESNEFNNARLLCSTEPGNAVSVTFNLANTLSNVAGTLQVPVSYGIESAILYDGTSEGTGGGVTPLRRFSPYVGTGGYISTTGNILLTLGTNGSNDPAAGVFVDLTNASPAVYSGVIVAHIIVQ